MSSTLQWQRRLRRLVPVVVVVLGLLLIGAVVIQQVAAQDSGGLKPPFKLNRASSTSSFDLRGLEPLPLTAPIIMSQTFNSTYTPVGDLNQRGWHESYASGATSQYTWKYAGAPPIPDTVWSAGSSLQSPATGTYTKGMQALLIYGPLNLSDYIQLVMTGTYWLDTAPGDSLGIAYSTDGTTWNEVYAQSGADPNLSKAQTFYAGLNQLARKPVAWIALTFVSNDDNLVGRGAFVKDVVLRGKPPLKTYVPIMRMQPTPTPQASTRYLYTFTSSNNLKDWGGDNSATGTDCGSGCTYYQNQVSGYGNPPPAFTLYMQGTNGKGGAGPRQNGASLSTATNFEYSADVYVYNGQLEARYGLAFDASGSTFPGSGDPPMSPNANYYLMEMRMDATDRTQVATWQFVKVENGSRHVQTGGNLPVSINQGQWHNLRVKQQGKTITFYINGISVASFTDNSGWDVARRRFGLYIQVLGSNGDNGPFEFFTDNITVKDLP